jgi:hypothetical protein
MSMDLWYGLRLLEMSDLNELTNELLRDAEQTLATETTEDEEE